jgi:hypothetical protein
MTGNLAIRFLPFSRPIYKNMYGFYGSRPTTSLYLVFHLPWPVNFSGEWGPFTFPAHGMLSALIALISAFPASN